MIHINIIKFRDTWTKDTTSGTCFKFICWTSWSSAWEHAEASPQALGSIMHFTKGLRNNVYKQICHLHQLYKWRTITWQDLRTSCLHRSPQWIPNINWKKESINWTVKTTEFLILTKIQLTERKKAVNWTVRTIEFLMLTKFLMSSS